MYVLYQVCELDIIFNFEKAYFMLDELVLGGEVCETSKKNVLKAIAAQDLLQEVRKVAAGGRKVAALWYGRGLQRENIRLLLLQLQHSWCLLYF